MKKFLILLPALFATSAFGQNFNIALSGTIQDSTSKKPIFHARFLVPASKSFEIFTGPYTVRLSAEKTSLDGYDISTEFFGLGPDFNYSSYHLKIAMGDSLPVLPLPVKDGETVRYTFALLDDTSGISATEPPPADTSAWGTSVSIHYLTHWLKGSYADFLWNLKMGYLEDVYNRYRSSFKLSEFDKIDFYFHPNPQTSDYLNPQTYYAIQPKARRIDLVFGTDIDVATPRPAAELLLYRMWGYAPRWMVTGFAGYYDDNFLQMRKLADIFKPSELASKFADESWVDSDTGRIVTGAFSRWLADNQLFSKFMELYRQSTALNFQAKFEKIYGKAFKKAAGDFLVFARSYSPKEGELEYYASEYLVRGNYKRAAEYLEEACQMPGDDSKPESQLVLSEFWLGDYAAAGRDIGPDLDSLNCTNDVLRISFGVAAGSGTPQSYHQLAYESHCAQAVEELSSYYLDQRQTPEAEGALNQINEQDKTSPGYLVILGRLKIMQGQPADSILKTAAAIALNRAQAQPQEPVNYYFAGQAYLFMKNFDKAGENLDISYFLEKRPYFQGLTLLELGRLADLQDRREDAENYYRQLLQIKAGAYQKSLAQKYLKNKYEL